MAAPINTDRAINLLPGPMREKVLEKLIAGEPCRKISAFLLQHGHRLHFTTIADYKRLNLPHYLATAEKLQQMQRDASTTEVAEQNVAKTTNALIAASVVDSRLNAKFDRYDEWFKEARQDRDFMALTSIDKSETQAIRLHAELTGRLQQTPNVAIQVVIGSTTPSDHSVSEVVSDATDVIDLGPKLR
jgi:uncharacterized membrane-anchored protein YjiN (DUF445 family)